MAKTEETGVAKYLKAIEESEKSKTPETGVAKYLKNLELLPKAASAAPKGGKAKGK
jgi:hypothetical protein